ncbi:MAG: replicative DNA helicase [Verrucomicrobiales bacterium]|nr:replicative DNA helicase [Verrucomicrobiales bacterium]
MIDANEDMPLPPVPEDLVEAPRRRAPQTADPGRVPPHSTDAEQAVLGCLLISPNDSIGLCLERLRTPTTLDENGKPTKDPDAVSFFYDLKHQLIFEVLVGMYEAKEAVDGLTLSNRLRDRGQLDTVGGPAYLALLEDSVPSAANLEYYLGIVWEKYLLRKMLKACTSMVQDAYNFEGGDVDQLLDEVETRIHRINDERAGERQADMNTLVHRVIEEVEAQHLRQGEMSGLPTGFLDLDKMTDGLHAGEMVVIAARPSMGKTSLAMNIVEHVVMEVKKSVGVFSLEMTAESLVTRMLFSQARMNLRNARDGFLSSADFPRMTASAGRLAKAPLYIDDTPGLSILQLRAKARRMKHQHDIQLIVVDYLQLLHSTSRRAKDNRQQEIAEISSGIKALAKELSLPVIILSQLNREMERDKNRKPRLSDLRESGAIEQDADIVGLLYKPSGGEDEEDGPGEGQDGESVNLLIAKQRNGPTGDVYMTFLKQYTRFENAARISPEDVPTD